MALHKMLVACALLVPSLVTPGMAQDQVEPNPLATTPANTLQAVRDCSAAASRQGVSNNELFARGWKLANQINEDGTLSPPDPSLPMRGYGKDSYPAIIADEVSPEKSPSCIIMGVYAEGYDHDDVVAELTNAFGPPRDAKDGVLAFFFTPDFILLKQHNNETGSLFKIVVQEFGE